jgi:hypothetical protein
MLLHKFRKFSRGYQTDEVSEVAVGCWMLADHDNAHRCQKILKNIVSIKTDNGQEK